MDVDAQSGPALDARNGRANFQCPNFVTGEQHRQPGASRRHVVCAAPIDRIRWLLLREHPGTPKAETERVVKATAMVEVIFMLTE
jgi:hypothetical protein